MRLWGNCGIREVRRAREVKPHGQILFVDFDDDGHSDWCKVTSHCSFDLHFRVAHF